MADLTTLLNKFLQDLYTGTVGTTVAVSTVTLTGPGSGVVLTNGSTTILNLAGTLTVTGSLNSALDIQLGATGFLHWTGRGGWDVPSNGVLRAQIETGLSGVELDVATTDGTLSVLSRAGADSAIVKASRFSVSATPGVVTFGPAAVASITVKGGIITAIS